jgi:uncharacterized membrane protein
VTDSVAVLLGLLAALAFGSSDFIAGAGGRRADAIAITAIAQPFGLLAALAGVALLHKGSPTPAVLEWGAISGVGSGLGTVALYRGLSAGAMNLVSPLAAVISAVLPALVGVVLGERLALLAVVGITLAVPALVMVSLTGRPENGSGGSAAPIVAGLVAGGGFALLFIALDRAGTAASAWPLVPGQAVAIIIVTLLVLARRPPRATWPTFTALGNRRRPPLGRRKPALPRGRRPGTTRHRRRPHRPLPRHHRRARSRAAARTYGPPASDRPADRCHIGHDDQHLIIKQTPTAGTLRVRRNRIPSQLADTSPRSPRRRSRRDCCSPHDPAANTRTQRCLCRQRRRSAQTEQRRPALHAEQRSPLGRQPGFLAMGNAREPIARRWGGLVRLLNRV